MFGLIKKLLPCIYSKSNDTENCLEEKEPRTRLHKSRRVAELPVIAANHLTKAQAEKIENRKQRAADNNCTGALNISELTWIFHSTDIIYSAAVPGYRVIVVEDRDDPTSFPFSELWKEEPVFHV